MSTRNMADADYAKMALLVMYAWDMCDQDFQNPASVALDPRIQADGWNVVGMITGADDIAVSGPSIRQQFMGAGQNRKRYGFLAVSAADATRYVAVIRGTDGAEEWADDFDFVSKSIPPFSGRVESGFVDIYRSMQYISLAAPGSPQTLADGISGAVPAGASVTVLAHSLGSSLGAFLTYDLADGARLGPARAGAILFACPKTGDHDFVQGFAARVTDYLVINYANDVVPTVPPFDILHLDIFRTLPYCRILTDGGSPAKINVLDKACCHHLISYTALLCAPAFSQAVSAAGWTADDATCSKCVTLPEGVS